VYGSEVTPRESIFCFCRSRLMVSGSVRQANEERAVGGGARIG
jgi:hypothetical protein